MMSSKNATRDLHGPTLFEMRLDRLKAESDQGVREIPYPFESHVMSCVDHDIRALTSAEDQALR